MSCVILFGSNTFGSDKELILGTDVIMENFLWVTVEYKSLVCWTAPQVNIREIHIHMSSLLIIIISYSFPTGNSYELHMYTLYTQSTSEIQRTEVKWIRRNLDPAPNDPLSTF